jgi:hypothetical protein
MKLLHPITGRGDDATVRVIVVVRNRCSSCTFAGGALARSYLQLFYDGPQTTVMVCDTAAPAARPDSLPSALAKIDAGDIDLVITTDLTRIARQFAEVQEFLRSCLRMIFPQLSGVG